MKRKMNGDDWKEPEGLADLSTDEILGMPDDQFLAELEGAGISATELANETRQVIATTRAAYDFKRAAKAATNDRPIGDTRSAIIYSGVDTKRDSFADVQPNLGLESFGSLGGPGARPAFGLALHSWLPKQRIHRFALFVCAAVVVLGAIWFGSFERSVGRVHAALLDDFRRDKSLNKSWLVHGAVTKAVLGKFDALTSRTISPQVELGREGLTLTVNGSGFSNVKQVRFGDAAIVEQTGIQSGKSFMAPFYAKVHATAPISSAAALQFVLSTSDGGEGVALVSSGSRDNSSRFEIMEPNDLGTRWSRSKGPFSTTSPNRAYSFVIDVANSGDATVTLTTGNTVIASKNDIHVGSGPFYIVLGESTSAHFTVGSGFWDSIEVGSAKPPSPKK